MNTEIIDARKYLEENAGALANIQDLARSQYIALYHKFARTGARFHMRGHEDFDPIVFQELGGTMAVVLGRVISPVLDPYTRKIGVMVKPVYGRKWAGLREDRTNVKGVHASGYLGDFEIQGDYIGSKRTMFKSIDAMIAKLSSQRPEDSIPALAALLEAPQQIEEEYRNNSAKIEHVK